MADIDGFNELHIRRSETKEVLPRLLEQGGRTLPEPHRGELVSRGKSQYPKNFLGAGGHTSGCGLPARAALPYEDHNGQQQVAVVCAICDAAPYFPRLQAQTVEHDSGSSEDPAV